MKKEIKIPAIAENVETGLIAGILVSKGDKVSKEQPVVEIETDKATTDIPSPFEGVVEEIKVSEGDEVEVDQVIMIIETESEEQDDDSDSERDKDEEEEKSSSSKEKQSDETEENKQDKKEEEDENSSKAQGDADEEKDEQEESQQKEESKDDSDGSIPASPSVRRLAREKDVNLNKLEGSGPGGRITKEDVEKASAKSDNDQPDKTEKKKSASNEFAKWGMISVEPMSTIRKLTGKNVQQAWQTIPHVTHFDEADITGLENFRKENQDKMAKEGDKVTITALLIKVAGLALQRFRRFNASLDADNDSIIYKHYYHIGIAVDTPDGLVVPVVRDVNRKSLPGLSEEMNDLAERARNKKLSTDEMQGGCFTISNLGGIGGVGFTPIVYAPQVAILGVSRSKYQAVPVDDGFEKRLILPLSLSYDHRVIDGADAARFLRWICEAIENPYNLLQ